MLATALAAARVAGQIIKEGFGRPHEVTSKGLRDVVTEVDLLAQEAIVARIRARFPEHQILAEEAAETLGPASAYCWFVDPLDGTTNYVRGIPYFCVSIAAAYEGELQVAAIYDPLRDYLFQASRGQGAFLGGRRLQVSARDRLIDAVLGLGWARGRAARRACIAVAEALGAGIGTVRTMGSAALGLAAVAAGWEDVYLHPQLQPWDMAAGVLLVREAGGVVTTPLGEPWHTLSGGCLASNGLLHQATLEQIAPVLAWA